jgi:hypothetical protein
MTDMKWMPSFYAACSGPWDICRPKGEVTAFQQILFLNNLSLHISYPTKENSLTKEHQD